MRPTEENLRLWRQQGMSNAEIAEETGYSVSRINVLFSMYKIPSRTRSVPQEDVDRIAELKKAGSSPKEIAGLTGYSVSTVSKYIKSAMQQKDEEEADLGPLEIRIFAEPRRPKITKVVINGHRYLDVTDLIVPC